MADGQKRFVIKIRTYIINVHYTLILAFTASINVFLESLFLKSHFYLSKTSDMGTPHLPLR